MNIADETLEGDITFTLAGLVTTFRRMQPGNDQESVTTRRAGDR